MLIFNGGPFSARPPAPPSTARSGRSSITWQRYSGDLVALAAPHVFF
jgi:hypothetical protein